MGKAGLLASLVLFSVSCSEAEKVVEPPPVTFARVASNDVAHGERIAAVLGCSGCHERNLQGRDWSDEMGVLWTANLTRSAEKHSDTELVSMITTGRKPGRDFHGMPSHIFTHLDPSDLAAILAFVRSKQVGGEVHPEPTFGPELRRMMAEGTYKSSAQEVAEQGENWPADAGPTHALGRYIVRATCSECHGLDLKGGNPPFPGDKERPDLTLIVPAYETADFLTLLHTGKAAGDREIGLMSEVSRNRFVHLSDDEVEAVRAYIVAISDSAP